MPMEEDICLHAAGLSTQTPSGSQIECATPSIELPYLILCDGKYRYLWSNISERSIHCTRVIAQIVLSR